MEEDRMSTSSSTPSSRTPRTDAVFAADPYCNGAIFARQLELELAQLRDAAPSSDVPSFEDAKAAIAEANNSLFGSQGYFLSTNGGGADKYHLAAPIERLKADCNRLREEARIWEQRCHEEEKNATQHYTDLQAARSATLPHWALDIESAWAEWSGGHITDSQFAQAVAEVVIEQILPNSATSDGGTKP